MTLKEARVLLRNAKGMKLVKILQENLGADDLTGVSVNYKINRMIINPSGNVEFELNGVIDYLEADLRDLEHFKDKDYIVYIQRA